MNYKTKSVLWWIFSVIFMLSVAIYQRLTGPTHPTRGKVEVEGEKFKYKLLTSYGGDDDCRIEVKVPNNEISGTFKYKRFKSFDEWSEVPMKREGDFLIGYVCRLFWWGLYAEVRIIFCCIITESNNLSFIRLIITYA